MVVEEGGRSWTAGEMLDRANQLVHGLRAEGLKPGDVLAVALGNRGELLQLALAALQAGWHFAPLDTRYTTAELSRLLRALTPRLLVHESELKESVADAIHTWDEAPRAIPLSDRLCETQPFRAPVERAAGAPLFVTSGTSGEPKVVKRELGRVPLEKVGRLAAVHLNAVCGIRPRSGLVHLVASPLTHSASLLWCLDHLHLGHRVVLRQKADAAGLLKMIDSHQVTGTLMVPTHFIRMLQLPQETRARFSGASLKHVVHTGAACPPSVKRKMLDWWGPVLTEVYGAAEGAGTRATAQEWLERPGTVGKGFGRIRIADSKGKLCPAGEVGTVYLKSPAQMSRSPDSALEGFFTVGDVGYLDEDDYLYLMGRTREVLVSGGVNVYPVEVEATLTSHPAVVEVGVFGRPDEEWGQRIEAAVVTCEEVTDKELDRHCREHLAGFKCPRSYHRLARLPRNANGKLKRSSLLSSTSAGTGV